MLEQEEIEILDGAFKSVKAQVTRHGIEHDLTALLKRGLTTTSAGGFFFIPYLLQLKVYDHLKEMGQPKLEGIPKERLDLGLLFESLFGYTKGVRSVDSVSRTDFGLLFGLPFLPSPSTQYRYLHSISVQEGLDFQVALGKSLVELGQVSSGFPVNIDAHNVKTYSRKEMKQSYLTKEERYGKAIRTFYTQDQQSSKPLLALATYPETKVAQVTQKITELTRHILKENFLLVADKEWYCGQLINELHQTYGVSLLVPIKRSKNRVSEFAAVPWEAYEKTVGGSIATVYTAMKDFDGPLRLFLKKRPDGKYFALLTPHEQVTKEMALPTYTKRWRIETFFGLNVFLGIDHLPSLNLNAIQAALSLRLAAFQAMDNFRNDLGDEHISKTPELIYRHFLDGVQGRVQLRGDLITVNIYGFQYDKAVASIFTNLNSKLIRAGVDPRIPWLGNRRLEFKFY